MQKLSIVLWTKLFIEAQGYQVNKSAILLETNGKKSSTKRTRALNIRYFYITDQVKQGNVRIKYCPTDKMVSDYMSKSLQGMKFDEFRNKIMGFGDKE